MTTRRKQTDQTVREQVLAHLETLQVGDGGVARFGKRRGLSSDAFLSSAEVCSY